MEEVQALRIYLVRHGKASKDMDKYADDEIRPLTKRGRADVDRIATQMAHSGIHVHQIRHSGILRAQETAEIFSHHLKPAGGLIAVKGLRWDDPVDMVARELQYETDPIMLVGHNPFMEQVTDILLTGTVHDAPCVTFSTSATVCLEFSLGKWSLRWMLTPDIVPSGEE
jgi:phosphohistidine phosphatase